MYFSLLPNLKYDKKPIQYPFSESDYVTVKNFFKRFQINQDVFSYTVLFEKYIISDSERVEVLAERAYGNPLYDWVIILTNNLINPSFDWPLSENDLRKHIEKNYDDPYTTIKHYEIIDEETQIENHGRVLYPAGTIVDETFYNTNAVYVEEPKPIYYEPPEPYDFKDSNSESYVISAISAQVRPTGLGTNDTNGFNVGKHLEFRGNATNRYAILKPINGTILSRVDFYAIRGNDINGGEAPDIPGQEELRLAYGYSPSGPWNDMGVLVTVDGDNGSYAGPGQPPGVAKYSKLIPESIRSENIYFKLYQLNNSGYDFDHYGVTLIEFTEDTSSLDLPSEYIIINSNYHIIDGEIWIYQNNVWKRKVSSGIKFNDGQYVQEVSGSSLCTPVTIFEYETVENEKKREIYLLKPAFLNSFVDDFKKQAKYKKSSSYVNGRLKETNI